MTARKHTKNAAQRELDMRALEHECPECNAKPGKRCRILGMRGYQSQGPHPERVTIAWRQMLRESSS